MPADRVLLESIKTLNFYTDERTAARRSKPIPQLTCVGKACKLYKPDAVQCFNVGGHGTDVSWKCEADLPEALRFGRVDVSCEGWSQSGDPYVLKGSCGLEYRLLEVPRHLYNDPVRPAKSSLGKNWSIADVAFSILWFGVLGVLLYSFLAPCFRDRRHANTPRNPRTPRPPNSGSWTDSNNYQGPRTQPPPPPPYTKDDPSSSTGGTGGGGWNPGFWTGLGLGGAATYLANNLRQQQQQPEQPPPRERQAYDWERTRHAEPAAAAAPRRGWMADSAGEGTSAGSGGMGEIRRATGVGGSSVR